MALLVPSRRGFLTGILALAAAPAIVRASSLMPIKVARDELQEFVITAQVTNSYQLTIADITREAVRLWKNSTPFIQKLNRQYDEAFAAGSLGSGLQVGDRLTIRMYNDFKLNK